MNFNLSLFAYQVPKFKVSETKSMQTNSKDMGSQIYFQTIQVSKTNSLKKTGNSGTWYQKRELKNCSSILIFNNFLSISAYQLTIFQLLPLPKVYQNWPKSRLACRFWIKLPRFFIGGRENLKTAYQILRFNQ